MSSRRLLVIPVILVVGIIAIGLLSAVNYEQTNATIASLNSQISSQSSVIANLSSVLSYIEANPIIITVSSTVTYTYSGANSFSIWNVPVAILGGQILVETVPDTFDYSDNFQSTGAVQVLYLSVFQFGNYTNGKPINGTFYCSAGTIVMATTSVSSCPSITSASDTFKLAEGCGGYLAIYMPVSSKNVTITPNVVVNYNPASSATGVCVS